MSSNTNMTCKASCTIISQLGASNQIMGHVSIVQPLPSNNTTATSNNSTVRITGTIHHLQPKTIHGISICQAGDLSNGATSCGPIFNPFGTCLSFCFFFAFFWIVSFFDAFAVLFF
jgi:hypothetical protein